MKDDNGYNIVIYQQINVIIPISDVESSAASDTFCKAIASRDVI